MTESNENRTGFLATYFDRDSVLKIARVAGIFAWIALGVYTFTTLISFTQFMLQVLRGLITLPGFTDIIQQLMWILQPALPALWNFIGLQAVGKVLLIFMDMEDNTRRAARAVRSDTGTVRVDAGK